MSYFDNTYFDNTYFDVVVVEPTVLPKPVRRGTPLNAYKQFKFIDRNGNTYYLKREGFSPYGR